jgi:ATP-dependent RNA helicase SUPV3L1/SUV3
MLGTSFFSFSLSTIEMVPLAQSFDVAVIDEIQMIADGQRGWAWTKALLSVKAKEVHICGEPTAIDLVKRLCKELGEEVEVREYTRLTPLSVEAQSLGGDEGKIVKGDCFVAFSRSEIFQQKKLIEKKTGLRAAVIYGSLPPESRASQAKLFNDQDSEYDILIASNAIGMGLNLNIKRVVFSTTRKFNGLTGHLLTVRCLCGSVGDY